MFWYTLMLILQAQVCGCTSAHPELPHQKQNGKLVIDNMSAKSSKLKAGIVLKFGSENQQGVLIIFQLFVIFP